MATLLRMNSTGSARARAALLSLAVGVAAATVTGLAYAEDGGGARRCVALTNIDRTEVVDDGTVLFHMRNGDVYRNVLRHECPTLKNRDQFAYRANAAQLCRSDLITVLERRGAGFAPGPSCSLGSFEAVGSGGAQ
ncbi:MAG TPA: hypothetical protein VFX89_03455 [Gammaproteobacteria bacterium]|nr:hypothetical protein [Gammaproteobacteria bacterium]